LTKVDNPSAYGLVETDSENNVLRFLEKPKAEDLAKININTINAGIYVLDPRVLDYIPAGENHSFEYQLFPSLLLNRENFHAFIAEDNYWLDIGTPQRYLQAHQDLIAGRIKNLQITKKSNFLSSNEAEIDARSWIAEGCVIKPKAKIINSVIGKGVVIEENTIVQNSVIWSGTKINSYTSVFDSIIGNDCQIGKNVLLTNGSVLGDQTVVANFTCY
jgi:mannose-1-phosphate guanylyltransferase